MFSGGSGILTPDLRAKADRFGIAGVHVARDADAGIVGEHSLDACGHFFCAVGDDDLARVLRVADAHAAAIVNRNPARAAGRIEQSIQQRPIGDGVRAVEHFFRFAIRRGDRAAIEVIAPDHDGRLQFASRDEIVQRQAEFVALAVAEPADARGQSLEAHALLRQLDPARQEFRCAGNISSTS